MSVIPKAIRVGKTVALFRRQIPVASVGIRNLTKVTHPGYWDHPNRKNVRKDFDYEKHPFKGYQAWYKRTSPMLTDNSKLIVVDSPVGIDREQFAQKLSEWYDMKVFPDVSIDDIMALNKGTPGEYDFRYFNDQLPRHLQFLDYEMLYTSKTPEEARPFVRTQMEIMKARMRIYYKAISHVLNTGQGVIMLRSWFDDFCFAHALYKMKVFTKLDYEYYMDLMEKPSVQLLCPHLVINLDAPVSYCMEQIKKRGRPYEQNSAILNEKFLEAYDYMYKSHVLKLQEDYSIILQYNVTNMPDWEYIEETFEEMTLDGPLKNDETKFFDWEYPMDIEITEHRRRYSSHLKYAIDDTFRTSFIKMSDTTMDLGGHDFDILEKIVNNHPALEYGRGYDPAYHGDRVV